MRTTFHALDNLDYPRDRYRIVAVPNHDDHTTIAALRRLQATFSWLEDPHRSPDLSSVLECGVGPVGAEPEGLTGGTRASGRVRDLPPKKTRQLIYAFYYLCPPGAEDTLISYIDADSASTAQLLSAGRGGAAKFDVVQLTNVAGNVLSSWASTFHSYDHMCWDASMYAQ